MDHAMYMAKVFHELDPVTPVTIGATFAENMIAMGDAVDVLSFHDYSTTRAQIRANIETAKAYAAKVGKPLFNSEIGCIARANPYDVTLEEHQRAHVGWYIWELMITPTGAPCTASSIPTAPSAIPPSPPPSSASSATAETLC